VATHAHVEGSLGASGGGGGPSERSGLTVARLVEAVLRVAVGGEDGDTVSAALQRHGGVDDQPLGSANTQVRVEEDGVLLRGHCAYRALRAATYEVQVVALPLSA
jgi:hypothetical protein